MNITKSNRYYSISFTILIVVLGFSGTLRAGEYIHIKDDLVIYYEEAGSGSPIVFIPGGTSTSWFFTSQLMHFSRDYRAIAYDPRNNGRSSKTKSGNSRFLLGHDLKAFLDALSLKDVILVGWSSGCFQGYDYFRAYGTENTKAFICIDSAPKPIPSFDDDWASVNSPRDIRLRYDGLAIDPVKTSRNFIQSMVTRQMTGEELDEIIEELMKKPVEISRYHMLEWLIDDISEDIKAIDGKIPVLFVMAEPGFETAKAWLAEHAPHTQIDGGFGLHMMFWEFPDRFNAIVDDFLSDIE